MMNFPAVAMSMFVCVLQVVKYASSNHASAVHYGTGSHTPTRIINAVIVYVLRITLQLYTFYSGHEIHPLDVCTDPAF